MPMQNRRPPSKYLPPRPTRFVVKVVGATTLLKDKDKTKINIKNKRVNNFKIHRGDEIQNTTGPTQLVVKVVLPTTLFCWKSKKKTKQISRT